MDKIKSLTGMLDLYDDGDKTNLPAKLFYLEKKIRDIFLSYKLNEIRTPILEDTNLFIRSVGGASDIVNKEIYSFNDRNEYNEVGYVATPASAFNSFSVKIVLKSQRSSSVPTIKDFRAIATT